MANVAHSTLTGSDLHEPKGISSAVLGTVYVANGSGGGSWADVGTASFTGMIADFVAPLPPSGWLELDGTIISTSTFSGLYAVMAIQTSGTRTNGSPIITSIASTASFRTGYFVFGTGITTGTTIISIDSANQITLSNNATSSGTSAFAVSPWLLNTGTIKLPDLTTAGRFRRSRTSATAVGQTQTSNNIAHTHSVSGTSGGQSLPHTHAISITTGTESATHTHSESTAQYQVNQWNPGGGGAAASYNTTGATTGTESATHTHLVSGNTSDPNVDHTHAISFTSGSTGTSETRPETIIVLTCVKT